jgi:hypothetical protein
MAASVGRLIENHDTGVKDVILPVSKVNGVLKQ